MKKQLYYSIQESARLLGITTNKIRFYEKKGLIKPNRGESNEYRYFTDEEVLRIHTIILYREIGLSIKDIKGLLGDENKENYLEHFYNQWKVINDEIHRLSQMRRVLENSMDKMYMATNEDYKQEILNGLQKYVEEMNQRNNWRDQWNFDNWARSYDRDVRVDKGSLKIYKNYDKVLETVVNQVKRYKGKENNVLEIGVGTGELANKFFELGYDIIGVDQSRAMLEVAKSKNKMLKVRLGEFMKLPFGNRCFDVIVSTYAFHHLNDREKEIALDEMIRVLKDDGLMILGDLMFEDGQSKKEIYENLTQEQIESIEDEYYTSIDKLERYLYTCDKNIDKIQIDRLCWVVIIK